MNQSDQQKAVAIVDAHLNPEQYNLHIVDGTVVVQLHLLPDNSTDWRGLSSKTGTAT
jgi:hypothetical protein